MTAFWLADILREAGLAVSEVPGWQRRGRPGSFGLVKGVMCHHTACSAHSGADPSLGTVEHGRPDLGGPLAQLLLGRDGVYHIIAAGRCNHAGVGFWKGIRTGNTSFIGIEAENTGLPGDPWPPVQMDAYKRGAAAILKHIGAGPIMCVGHKEYALPNGRKSDPDFDMPAFRADVAKLMEI